MNVMSAHALKIPNATGDRKFSQITKGKLKFSVWYDMKNYIFIEEFLAWWPWTIGMLESWLSMSSSSEVLASSIFSSLQRTHLQRPLLRMSLTTGDKTLRGRNPENGRCRDFGRRQHWQTGFQHTYRPRPSSPEFFNKDHNTGCESHSHLMKI